VSITNSDCATSSNVKTESDNSLAPLAAVFVKDEAPSECPKVDDLYALPVLVNFRNIVDNRIFCRCITGSICFALVPVPYCIIFLFFSQAGCIVLCEKSNFFWCKVVAKLENSKNIGKMHLNDCLRWNQAPVRN
jgi:hypothetical protein